MHAALLSTFAGGAFSFGLNFGAPSMENEARGGIFEPVPEAVMYAAPMTVEVPYHPPDSNSDNMSWRDRDGDSCWGYANHYNGAKYACTAPSYEDALYYCGKTCGRYREAVPTDDMSWRDTDGSSCFDVASHAGGPAWYCTYPGFEYVEYYCAKTCGPYKGWSPQAYGSLPFSNPKNSGSSVVVPETPWSSGNGPRVLRKAQCAQFDSCSACVLGTTFAGDECSWDDNTGRNGACKKRNQCNYHETAAGMMMAGMMMMASGPETATVTVCVEDLANCVLPSTGKVVKNDEVGSGCTTHEQCGRNMYCFSCELCQQQHGFGECGDCDRDWNAAGSCGPRNNCYQDNDAINGFCPRN